MTCAAPRLRRLLRAAPLVLGLIAGGPAFALLTAGSAHAQTGTAKPAGKAGEKPAAEKPAAAQEAPAVRTETVTYGNWIVTCRDTVGSTMPRSCGAVLRITDTKSRQNVLVWQIGNDASNNPVLALRTPLGVRMKEGVAVALGGGKPRRLDYVFCDARGCEAAGPLDPAFARELGAAAEAAVSFTPVNGKPITVTFPIKGIGDALAALRRQPR